MLKIDYKNNYENILEILLIIVRITFIFKGTFKYPFFTHDTQNILRVTSPRFLKAFVN